MGECKCDKLIYNGLQRNCSEFDNSLFFARMSLYEVVRVINGKPVFLDDHIERLENSVIVGGRGMLMEKMELSDEIHKLIDLVSVSDGNMKISFNYVDGNEYSLIYFIEALYPDDILYKNGVHTILFNAERDNPDIKIYNYQLRSQIYDKLVRTHAFEALLVNSNNCITEGSKSNIFFVNKDTIITAPEGSVLSGITRKYIVRLIINSGLNLEQRCLPLNELNKIDAVFISGTSPKVLPVKSVGDQVFNVNNDHVRFLMSAYNDLLDKHIRNH